MLGLWIDESILSLKRTPAEKLLLALICYRAGISKEGVCKDSNKELSLAIGIHAQSVSDLVQKFEKDGLITTSVSKEKANVRSISPIRNFLTPYKEKADSYKEKTDSDYKEIPYSTPETGQTLSGNSLDPYKEIPYPYKSIPYSLYKDRKPLEKVVIKNSIKLDDDAAVAAGASSADDQKKVERSTLDEKKENPTPPVPAAPPPQKLPEGVGDGRLRADCLAYNRDNPDKYPPKMYKAFLAYWTAPVRNGTKKSEIGKELWDIQKTWSLAGRLSNWHQRETENEHQRNAPNGRKSADFLNSQQQREPAKNGYGAL